MQGAIANAYSVETSGNATVVFPWRSRQLVLTNDSSVATMRVTLPGATITIGGDESISANLWIHGVTVSATANWRLWAFG